MGFDTTRVAVDDTAGQVVARGPGRFVVRNPDAVQVIDLHGKDDSGVYGEGFELGPTEAIEVELERKDTVRARAAVGQSATLQIAVDAA